MLPTNPAPQPLDSVRRWAAGGQRAPHKPLLLLMVIARMERGEPAEIVFADTEATFADTLRAFCPSVSNPRLGYPFWRLRNDEVWTVTPDDFIVNSAGDVSVQELRRRHAVGRLRPDVQRQLAADPLQLRELVARLAEMVVGASQVQDLLDAVQMPWVPGRLHDRDPGFRRRIMALYDSSCAACGFNAQLGHMSIGVDAAHLWALSYGGCNDDSNGLALCAIHHRAFDLGAIGIDGQMRWAASEKLRGLVGSPAVAALFGKLPGAPLVANRHGGWPSAQAAAWHWRNVFVGPALVRG